MANSVCLRSGAKMPMLGLGTWLSEDASCKAAVLAALKLGCRLIDTAAMYKNEEAVGKAISESGLPRSDLFVVTKLATEDHPDALNALKRSLAKLGLEYVDLFLIHSPSGKQCTETWRSCLQAREEGLAKDVGTSNFGQAQLEGLKAASLELPAVNQIELHPWNQQKETHAYHDANNVVTMGYCPLARCKRFGQKTAVASVAERLQRTEAAVALRWSMQSGVVTIPKSTNLGRIAENWAVAGAEHGLDAATMAAINAADEGFKASNSVNNMELPWDVVK